MSFLTPQEKKRLSYAHDRRNVYRENSKASRKAIPLRKQKDRRSDRRVAQQVSPLVLAAKDPLADDSVENRIAVHAAKKKRTKWRKTPDAPLGQVLKRGKNIQALRRQ